MFNTAQALLVFVVGLLPGALYTWTLEREVGNWGIKLTDRAFRFLGASAVFWAVTSYPAYRIWLSYFHGSKGGTSARTFRNALRDGEFASWWFWLAPLAYVGIPIAFGYLAAWLVRRRSPLARIFVGRDPAPRAWDYFFSHRPAGVVRAQLNDDTWIAGVFGANSYASGFPEEPRDLYLERTLQVLDDGTFVPGEEGQGFRELGSGMLIPWEQMKFLEFFEYTSSSDERG